MRSGRAGVAAACSATAPVDTIVLVTDDGSPPRIEVGRLVAGEWLGRRVHVQIDRPKGSHHPEHGHVIETDYGFVPGTLAPDGDELDAYVLGADGPIAECDGEVVAVIHRRDDVEDKLVVAVGGAWDHDAIAAAVDFQERWFDSQILTSGGHG